MSDEINNLTRILNKLSRARFYGEILVKIEGGKIVHSKCTQSLKLDRVDTEQPIVFEESEKVIEIVKKTALDNK